MARPTPSPYGILDTLQLLTVERPTTPSVDPTTGVLSFGTATSFTIQGHMSYMPTRMTEEEGDVRPISQGPAEREGRVRLHTNALLNVGDFLIVTNSAPASGPAVPLDRTRYRVTGILSRHPALAAFDGFSTSPLRFPRSTPSTSAPSPNGTSRVPRTTYSLDVSEGSTSDP